MELNHVFANLSDIQGDLIALTSKSRSSLLLIQEREISVKPITLRSDDNSWDIEILVFCSVKLFFLDDGGSIVTLKTFYIDCVEFIVMFTVT
jgi:hypothetical protein